MGVIFNNLESIILQVYSKKVISFEFGEASVT